MKFLLDTNVLIPLEPTSAATVSALAGDAARLHSLAVRHGHQVFIHPAVRRDIARDPQQPRRTFFEQQVQKYPRLLDAPPASEAFITLIGSPDVGTNDWVDNQLLVALYANAVDYLVTEDQGIHRKARRLDISERVARVDEAIRLISDLADEAPPPPPLVSAVPAYRLNAADAIFDSFREDYPGFDGWLQKCQREHRQSWMIEGFDGGLAAVVIVNPEKEPPSPATGRVLKICTMKVAEEAFGLRYGELLLKVVFDYAVQNGYEWLYVTAFDKHAHLIQLFEDFGFSLADARTSLGELQFVKPVGKTHEDGRELGPLEFHVRHGPPHVRLEGVEWYVVPILPQFSNLLFPETEDQFRFADPRPYGNAIRKAYLSNANIRDIEPGSLLWFYRSEVDQGLVALGVAERAVRSSNPDEIARSVGKRTVYSLEQIRKMCEKEVFAVLFRQARAIQPPIPTAQLVRHGVFSQPPQSITRIKPEGQAWLRSQLQL